MSQTVTSPVCVFRQIILAGKAGPVDMMPAICQTVALPEQYKSQLPIQVAPFMYQTVTSAGGGVPPDQVGFAVAIQIGCTCDLPAAGTACAIVPVVI